MSFVVVIPARYASSRLPAKPLVDIAGKPMIQWVYEQAKKSAAQAVVIATDDERIFAVAKSFGAEVCMTRVDHNSGTERLAEVCDFYQWPADTIVVNVQGDEPLVPPAIIDQVAENLAKAQCNMATLSVAITDKDELFNPNAVKVVSDKHGYALYFSRATIPYARDQFAKGEADFNQVSWQRHIGIYAYRAGFIAKYLNWPASPLEAIESLEQLRVLYHGERIHVAQACIAPAAGVDTEHDLQRVRAFVAQQQ